MSRADGRAENLLGALGLAIADRMGDAIVARAGHASSDAVALSALQDFLDAPTVDRLSEVLGLTSSGTVRLVDRLEGAGLVTRRMGADGRSTHVTLTAAGRRAGHAVATARLAFLHDALAALTPDERRTFGRLTGKVLAGMVRPPGATRWTCRLCATRVCGRPEGLCPVANAGLARAAVSPSGPEGA
jgi:DNA-binding MarR family transcriptional regulator